VPTEPIAILSLNHIVVINGSGPGRFIGQSKLARQGTKEFLIAMSYLASLAIPFGETTEL